MCALFRLPTARQLKRGGFRGVETMRTGWASVQELAETTGVSEEWLGYRVGSGKVEGKANEIEDLLLVRLGEVAV